MLRIPVNRLFDELEYLNKVTNFDVNVTRNEYLEHRKKYKDQKFLYKRSKEIKKNELCDFWYAYKNLCSYRIVDQDFSACEYNENLTVNERYKRLTDMELLKFSLTLDV